MMTQRFAGMTAAALCVAALAATPMSAFAQQRDDREAIRIALTPQAEAHGQGSGSVRSETTTRIDELEVRVVTENDKTRIFLNGREIDTKGKRSWTDSKTGVTVERRGDRVIVTDKDGRQILSHGAGSWGQFFSGDGEWRFTTDATDGEHPPVMLGVTLEALEEADDVADELDVKPKHATVIRRVFPGLPAAKAGIEAGDVVFEIDGSRKADPETLQALLAEKEPGQTMRLKVLRQGKPKEITVELAPFDSERLGAPRAFSMTIPGGGDRFFSDEARQRLEELQRTLAAQASEMALMQKRMGRLSGREAEEFARRMAAIAEEMSAKSAEIARRSAELTAPDLSRFLFNRETPTLKFRDNGDSPRAVIVAPEPPEPPAAPRAADGERGTRLEDINKRLDRLERLLERLIEEREDD